LLFAIRFFLDKSEKTGGGDGGGGGDTTSNSSVAEPEVNDADESKRESTEEKEGGSGGGGGEGKSTKPFDREEAIRSLEFRMSLLGGLAGIKYDILPRIMSEIPAEQWEAVGRNCLELPGMLSSGKAAEYVWVAYKRVCLQDIKEFVRRISTPSLIVEVRVAMEKFKGIYI
jgi:hypothetical protein